MRPLKLKYPQAIREQNKGRTRKSEEVALFTLQHSGRDQSGDRCLSFASSVHLQCSNSSSVAFDIISQCISYTPPVYWFLFLGFFLIFRLGLVGLSFASVLSLAMYADLWHVCDVPYVYYLFMCVLYNIQRITADFRDLRIAFPTRLIIGNLLFCIVRDFFLTQ